MRPTRRYEIHFAHPDDPKPVKLIAFGETPCRAKDQGFEMLQAFLRLESEAARPQNGWRRVHQEDLGVVE